MITSVDTNILLYALDSSCPEHDLAVAFLDEHASDTDFALCELVLVELYVLLRNPKILAHPLPASHAVNAVQALRSNPRWYIIESAPGAMQQVWQLAGAPSFPRRRIFDARLAVTLRRHGVTAFATHNIDDFQGFSFERLWDPVAKR